MKQLSGALSYAQRRLAAQNQAVLPVQHHRALVRVVPTFVSYRGSHAFRNKGFAMVQHTETGEWRERVPVERERAMGFPEGYTQVVGISETETREMLGMVMDPHTL